MSDVTIRELRNRGGDVVDRVARGEHITITRSGRPVAVLTPVRAASPSVDSLIARRRSIPPVDPVGLRADIDALLDPAL